MRTATPLWTCWRITERAVGDFAFDLDAAVDGTRVHDDRLGLWSQAARLGVRGRTARCIRRGEGKWVVVLALVLDAQEHHRVGSP
jgi:hypothetical protein